MPSTHSVAAHSIANNLAYCTLYTVYNFVCLLHTLDDTLYVFLSALSDMSRRTKTILDKSNNNHNIDAPTTSGSADVSNPVLSACCTLALASVLLVTSYLAANYAASVF